MIKPSYSVLAQLSFSKFITVVFLIFSALQVGMNPLQAQQLPRFPQGTSTVANAPKFRLAEGMSVFTPIATFPIDETVEFPFSDPYNRSAWWVWTAPFTGRCELDMLKEAKKGSVFNRVLFVYEKTEDGSMVPARIIPKSNGIVPGRNDGPQNLGFTSFMAQKGKTYHLRTVISTATPDVQIRLKLKLVAKNNTYIGNWRMADEDERTKAMGQITLRVNDKGRFTGQLRSTFGTRAIKGKLDENRQASLTFSASATQPQAALSLDLATQDGARFSLKWDETTVEAPLDTVGLYSPAFPPVMALHYSLALEPNSDGTGIGGLYLNPNRSGNIIGAGWGPDGEKLTFNTQIIYRKNSEISQGYEDFVSIYALSKKRQSDLLISGHGDRYTLEQGLNKAYYVRQPVAESNFYSDGLDLNLKIGSVVIPEGSTHFTYRGLYNIRVVDAILDEGESTLEAQLRINDFGKVFFSSQGIEKRFSADWKRQVVSGKILWDGELLPLRATLGYESAQPFLKGIVTSPAGTFSVKTTFIE